MSATCLSCHMPIHKSTTGTALCPYCIARERDELMYVDELAVVKAKLAKAEKELADAKAEIIKIGEWYIQALIREEDLKEDLAEANKELSEAKGLAKQLLKAIAVHRAKQIERKQFVDPIDKELWEVLK